MVYKYALPLMYKPGTSFAYSPGNDLAGKAIEAATYKILAEFMRENVCEPLGLNEDASFFARKKPGMKDRIAGLNLVSDEPGMSAVDASALDPMAQVTDYFGGAGLYISADAYYAFLCYIPARLQAPRPRLVQRALPPTTRRCRRTSPQQPLWGLFSTSGVSVFEDPARGPQDMVACRSHS
ncbi:hypothetical protein BD289DRAFT_494074 [Coniella lustricola]|uniref:Beta-lactamase-related domain-containing protein n=1 Tax=Coniella lustricola TaxID=2025994 RepID=A0A2T2ZVB9_9PEZI|nr:hypothetical protein BD289DRAFT_494074 [Coniella lustricola]